MSQCEALRPDNERCEHESGHGGSHLTTKGGKYGRTWTDTPQGAIERFLKKEETAEPEFFYGRVSMNARALAAEIEALQKERDRWFLRTAAILDATNDTCDRGYCVLEDNDCITVLEDAASAVQAAARSSTEEKKQWGLEQDVGSY